MARTLQTPVSLLPSWKEPDESTIAAAVAVAEPLPAEPQAELPLDDAPAVATASDDAPFDTDKLDGETFVTSVEYGPPVMHAVDEQTGEIHPVDKPALAVGVAIEDVVFDKDGNVQLGTIETAILSPSSGWFEERKLLDPIYAVQREIMSLVDAETDLAKQLEEIRNQLEASKKAKAMLLEKLPEQLIKLRDGIEIDKSEPDDATLAVEPATPEPQEPVDPLAWRDNPTAPILKGVPRLGDTKAAAIVDAYPTLGALSDARAKALASRRHFSEELPKGVGKQIADEIANRLMAAEIKIDEPPCSEVVEPRTSEAQKREQWVRAMATSLRAGATLEMLSADANESWTEGLEASQAGESVHQCPTELTEEYQIQWIRGWLAHNLFMRDLDDEVASVDDTEDGEAEPTASDDSPVAVHITTEVETIDEELIAVEPEPVEAMAEFDIQSLAETLKQDSFDVPRTDKDAWKAGFSSAIDGNPLEACPDHPNLEYRKDWVRGWLASQDEGI